MQVGIPVAYNVCEVKLDETKHVAHVNSTTKINDVCLTDVILVSEPKTLNTYR